MLEFFVRDTGAGISEEDMAQIFTPFFQSDSTTSRRHGGVGLGLTISRRLVELMGGSLNVRSEPGAGSEFAVIVPIEIPVTLPETQPAITQTPLDAEFATRHPLNILVVDDDKINLKLCLTLVRNLGYNPLSAENGVRAIEVFKAEHPDCILMDVQMPEMDGFDATAEIRKLEAANGNQRTFISAFTANILPADRQRCFDAGMDYYLNKPIKKTTLAQALATAASK